MSDQRARVVLDAPISEEAVGLLNPVIAREIAEEVRAVYQNALIEHGIATRFESESSRAQVHLHIESPCMTCRNHALNGVTSY